MSVTLPIALDEEAVTRFARQHRIEKLSLFGSTVNGDFTDESDVDVLVEFEPGHNVSYFTLIDMEEELAAVFGRKTEICTAADLSPYFRDEVIASAYAVYEAAR